MIGILYKFRCIVYIKLIEEFIVCMIRRMDVMEIACCTVFI